MATPIRGGVVRVIHVLTIGTNGMMEVIDTGIRIIIVDIQLEMTIWDMEIVRDTMDVENTIVANTIEVREV